MDRDYVHFTNIDRIRFLAKRRPMIEYVTEQNCGTTAEKSFHNATVRASKGHQSPHNVKLTFASSGTQMIIRYTVSDMHDNLSVVWYERLGNARSIKTLGSNLLRYRRSMPLGATCTQGEATTSQLAEYFRCILHLLDSNTDFQMSFFCSLQKVEPLPLPVIAPRSSVSTSSRERTQPSTLHLTLFLSYLLPCHSHRRESSTS